MNFVITPGISHLFRHQVASVGSGVDQHIGRPLFYIAIQKGLEGAEIPLTFIKGEIVAKQNKSTRRSPQLGNDLRQRHDIPALEFDYSQPLRCKRLQQALDKRRLATATLTPKQYIIGR